MSTDLGKRILAAFEREPQINLHRFPIRVEVQERIVVLEGEVEDVAAKRIALELAAAMPGVDGIVDRLRVARGTPMTDGELGDHLRDAWLQEPVFRDVSLSLEIGGRKKVVREARGEPDAFLSAAVQGGVVTLNGQVPSLSHKRLAGVLAWWIPGTRDVINGVEVAPDQIDNDDEISDAVRMALEKIASSTRRRSGSIREAAW